MGANLSVADLLRQPELWADAALPFLPTEAANEQLASYIEMLLVWNNVLNLSAYHNAADILRNLIQDSFFLAVFLENLLASKSVPQIYDPGAGAGLPGIPLRICWRRGNYIMLESRQKRALFLANALAKLKVPCTTAICARAEQHFANAPPADCIVSRAFMPWPRLLAFCRPALAPDGLVVIMANEPPPILKASLEDSWKLKGSLEYLACCKPRWLWAMTARD